MSADTQPIAVRDVEIRSWPERADLVVIDINRARVLAHYPLNDPRPYTIWNPKAPYGARAEQAIEFLEDEQEYLRLVFGVDAQHIVKLQPTPVVRQRIQELLADYGLSLQDIEFAQLSGALARLSAEPVDRLYDLLCDWYDTVERHYPAGAARQDPGSWVHNAHPDRAVHHHAITCEVTDRSAASDEQTEQAYEFFRELIDVDLQHFSFGHALRWLYYHRTEFADRSPFELRAIPQAATAGR